MKRRKRGIGGRGKPFRSVWIGLINAIIPVLFVATGIFGRALQAEEDVSQAAMDNLRREVEELRVAVTKKNFSPSAVQRGTAEIPMTDDRRVTTKTGKLTIGGYLQVWYCAIANDNQGVFGNPTVGGDVDNNEAQDNDGFAIRRARLKLTADVHEYIQWNTMLDFACEWGYRTHPGSGQGVFKRRLGAGSQYAQANRVETAGGNGIANAQTGDGNANRILIDSYLLFHGFCPHHEFTLGQYKPRFGLESTAPGTQLDFVERAMATEITPPYDDLGVGVHGFWWGEKPTEARFQYWLDVVNGAGNWFGTSGKQNNRADDNDAKDFYVTALIRPLKDETWGALELGHTQAFGLHGEAGDKTADGSAPVSGLGRLETWAHKHASWAHYAPGGPAKGWWLKGEYLWIKDRNAPRAVVDLWGNASGGGRNATYQAAPNPFDVDGLYFSTGYKLADSVWSEDLKKGTLTKFIRPLEFTFRYQTFGNILVADATHPDGRTDVFKTSIYTAGFNYYLKKHNAKIQVNYNWVNEPNENSNQALRGMREVNNNSLTVNFQVAF
jgi:hypothetical protein